MSKKKVKVKVTVKDDKAFIAIPLADLKRLNAGHNRGTPKSLFYTSGHGQLILSTEQVLPLHAFLASQFAEH